MSKQSIETSLSKAADKIKEVDKFNEEVESKVDNIAKNIENMKVPDEYANIKERLKSQVRASGANYIDKNTKDKLDGSKSGLDNAGTENKSELNDLESSSEKMDSIADTVSSMDMDSVSSFAEDIRNGVDEHKKLERKIEEQKQKMNDVSNRTSSVKSRLG